MLSFNTARLNWLGEWIIGLLDGSDGFSDIRMFRPPLYFPGGGKRREERAKGKEQRAKSKEQRTKSKEQRAKNKEQRGRAGSKRFSVAGR